MRNLKNVIVQQEFRAMHYLLLLLLFKLGVFVLDVMRKMYQIFRYYGFRRCTLWLDSYCVIKD